MSHEHCSHSLAYAFLCGKGAAFLEPLYVSVWWIYVADAFEGTEKPWVKAGSEQECGWCWWLCKQLQAKEKKTNKQTGFGFHYLMSPEEQCLVYYQLGIAAMLRKAEVSKAVQHAQLRHVVP